MSHPEIILNYFLYPVGHHEAAWRHPDAKPERLLDVDYYIDMAKKAEAAKLDAIFLADGLSLGQLKYKVDSGFEPITLLTALATHTRNIGLIATASTTYYDPFNLARLFASLDHVSKGRAGWNAVTTDAWGKVAGNFGLSAHPTPEERYARSKEFIEAVLGLWDTWDDDAVVQDKIAGVYADPAKIHQTVLQGAHINIDGALNVQRSPQGRPVLVQAGASDAGRQLASKYAEVIFTGHQTLADAQAFYADVKARAQAQFGRSPNEIKVLPGLSPFIGQTESEAKKLEQELNELTVVEFGLKQLQIFLGVDLGGLDLDKPIPKEVLPDLGDVLNNAKGRLQLVGGIIQRENPTLRQLLHRLAAARGHLSYAGSAEQVADLIENWVKQRGADGFNIMPPYYPDAFDRFVDWVVPILQERKLFRTEYEGSTLRENYRLHRPHNWHANDPGLADSSKKIVGA